MKSHKNFLSGLAISLSNHDLREILKETLLILNVVSYTIAGGVGGFDFIFPV